MNNNEIIDFINRRFKKDCDWICGNCYYFASILKIRFPQGDILYDMVDNHFLFLYCGKFYDWRGVIINYNIDNLISLDKLKEDYLLYSRIIRDCIM